MPSDWHLRAGRRAEVHLRLRKHVEDAARHRFDRDYVAGLHRYEVLNLLQALEGFVESAVRRHYELVKLAELGLDLRLLVGRQLSVLQERAPEWPLRVEVPSCVAECIQQVESHFPLERSKGLLALSLQGLALRIQKLPVLNKVAFLCVVRTGDAERD
jgi:hypothetical protein